jgi:methyl-accepting chemotaxis protein
MTKETSSGLLKGKLNGKDIWMIQIWAPMIPDGKTIPIGAIGININLNTIEQLCKDAPILHGTYPNGRLIVFAQDGTAIAHYNEQMIGKKITDKGIADIIGQKAITDTKRTLETFKPDIGENNERFFVSYPFKLGDADYTYTTFSSVPENDIFIAISNMRTFTFILAGLMIIITTIIVWFTSSSIVKRIVKVVNIMKDIAQGEGDLTVRIEANSKDEIGDLGNYFNQTMEKIQNMIKIIK